MVIEVSGELDLATAPLLERAFAEALDETPDLDDHQAVVVDLGAVDFIDSAALLVLLRANEALQDTGRSLTLVPSPTVTRTLELAGLASTLAVRDALPGDAPPA